MGALGVTMIALPLYHVQYIYTISPCVCSDADLMSTVASPRYEFPYSFSLALVLGSTSAWRQDT